MSFQILAGKKLAAAIKGFGAKVASFTELQHQLGYSCLAHAEEHHCASHLNNLFAVTPTNFRAALRVWACNFGKVKFVAEPEEAGAYFAYDKATKSDLPGALAISPAEFVKAKSAGADKAFDELKAIESFLTKMKDKGATKRTIDAIEGAARLLRSEAEAAAAKPVKAPRAKGPKLAVSNAPVPAGWDKVEGGGEVVAPVATAA